MSKTQGIKATTGSAEAPPAITTDVSPVNQPILPSIQTVPEEALFMGGAYKDLTAMVKSTWLQTPSLFNIPLNATSGTVVLNIPLYGEMLSDPAKVFIALHSRFFGSVHFRVTVFGASTLIGGLEVGWTIRRIVSPSINDLRVIKGETIPANNCSVYTFKMGPIVPGDGIMRNFFNTSSSETTFVDIATMNWTDYPHFVVLQNVPLQSNITAESLSQVYMRIESLIDPNFVVALDNIQRLTAAKNLLFNSTFDGTLPTTDKAGTFTNLIGKSMGTIFKKNQLYLSLDGLYSLNETDLRIVQDQKYFNYWIKWYLKLTLKIDRFPFIGTIISPYEDEQSRVFYYAQTGSFPMLHWTTSDMACKFGYSQVTGATSGSVSMNVGMTWLYGVLVLNEFGTEDFEYDLKMSDEALKSINPITTHLETQSSIIINALTYEGTIQTLVNVAFQGDDLELTTFFYDALPYSSDATVYGIAPNSKATKVDGKTALSISFLPRAAVLIGQNSNRYLFFYRVVIGDGHICKSGTAVEITSPKVFTGNYVISSSVKMKGLIRISDFTFSYGPYLNAPSFTLFKKVPEYSRRVVFTDKIPQSVAQGLKSDGIPTVTSLSPYLFPDLDDNEVLNFNLITPNNNQTIFTVSYAKQYDTFYIVPNNQSLDLYAVYNSHDCQNLIFSNPVKTTVGNLPRTSLAVDFQSRITEGVSTDTLILPTRIGPRLTTVKRELLEKYAAKKTK